jgi:hypothetical protein
MNQRIATVGRPVTDRLALVGRQVAQDDVQLKVGVDVQVDPAEERQHVTAGVGSAGVVQHLPGPTFGAANRSRARFLL